MIYARSPPPGAISSVILNIRSSAANRACPGEPPHANRDPAEGSQSTLNSNRRRSKLASFRNPVSHWPAVAPVGTSAARSRFHRAARPSGPPRRRLQCPSQRSQRPQPNRYPPLPQVLTSKMASFRISSPTRPGRPQRNPRRPIQRPRQLLSPTATQSLSPFPPGPHEQNGFVPYFVSNPPRTPPAEPPPPDPTPPPTPLTDRNSIAIPLSPRPLRANWLRSVFRSNPPPAAPADPTPPAPTPPPTPPPTATQSLSPLSPRPLRANWLRSVFRLQPATGRAADPTPPAPTAPANSPHRTQPHRYPPFPPGLYEQNGFVPYSVSNPPPAAPADPRRPLRRLRPTPPTERNPIAIPLCPRSLRANWLRSVFRFQPAAGHPSRTPPPPPTPRTPPRAPNPRKSLPMVRNGTSLPPQFPPRSRRREPVAPPPTAPFSSP